MRLHEQKSFTEPLASRELRQEYRAEANPAATFLAEHVESKKGKTISTGELYQKYISWMRTQNATPLGATQFTREVKKSFPLAGQSENAKRQLNNQRSRNWEGLDWIEDIEDFL